VCRVGLQRTRTALHCTAGSFTWLPGLTQGEEEAGKPHIPTKTLRAGGDITYIHPYPVKGPNGYAFPPFCVHTPQATWMGSGIWHLASPLPPRAASPEAGSSVPGHAVTRGAQECNAPSWSRFNYTAALECCRESTIETFFDPPFPSPLPTSPFPQPRLLPPSTDYRSNYRTQLRISISLAQANLGRLGAAQGRGSSTMAPGRRRSRLPEGGSMRSS
jgi:hypothetical protein